MSALVQYAASSDEDSDASPEGTPALPGKTSMATAFNSAPKVDVGDEHLQSHTSYALSQPLAPGQAVVAYNAKAQAMGPIAGPVNPFSHREASVVETAVDDAMFDSGLNQGNIDYEQEPKAKRARRRRQKDTKVLAAERAAALQGDSVWAIEEDSDAESVGASQAAVPEEQRQFLAKLEEKQERARKRQEEQTEEKLDAEVKVVQADALQNTATSEFHGTEEYDYQGRSWTHPPSTLRSVEPKEHDSALPKRLLHTWEGHSKGVQQIEWFPKLAHLLLSCSLDSTCKIFGVYDSTGGGNGRGPKRTYRGHSSPVRAINFNADGSQFVSAGYDKRILLWDVESGAAELSFSVGATANAVQYYPEDNNLLLCACSDRKIHQFDRRVGKVVQKYEHHLNAVNTLTFYDQNRRFLSTSDDKVMLAWEMNIPVPIKYIQDPSMQSMPVVRHHPTTGAVACQSMDNQVLSFDVGDTVRAAKKRFTGHNNAGFACGLDFSPNGKFLCSGDSSGRIFYWDWRSGKKVRELQAHQGHPCLGVRWHPQEPSWMATCAWDGKIKLWE